MSVLLLEAAWPRLRSKFAGAVRPAKPPKRPSRRPWLGRFSYSIIVGAFKRSLALRDKDSNVSLAIRWSATFRIGSITSRKLTTPNRMRLEKVSPRSLHLSYEIGATPLSNLYDQNGDVTLTTRLRPHGNAGIWKKKKRTVQCLPLSEYLTN
jgi:hypothetical protein